MKQIKTIKNRLDNAEQFDKEVNAALAEGWTLTKRVVLQPYSQTDSFHTHTMLYAELERLAEPDCNTCKHHDKDYAEKPCNACFVTNRKWEGKES